MRLHESYAEIPLPERAATPLRAGLSLKEAGDMRLNAAERRSEFLRLLGVAPERVYACRQLHSTSIVQVRAGPPPRVTPDGDGLVTDRPEAVLTLTVADCLPIFLLHRRGRAFGLLHSGWKGTGIVTGAVRLFADEYGCPPGELAVVIGPGIGACCYAVDRERYELYRSRFGDRSVRRQAGRWYIDLREANRMLLAETGVTDVAVVPECTACTPYLASFRRDGPAFRRMLAFIGAIEL